MSSVRVAYNEKEAPLEVLLRTIDRPGDFCTRDRMLVPNTLICTKTRGSYERRCAQYARDVAHMRMLVAAAPDSGAAVADDLRRLHAVLAHA